MSGWESEPLGSLSSREQQVAALICSGLPNKLIANRLGLSLGTVKQHVHNIFLKLGARTRVQLMLLMADRPAIEASATDSSRGAVIQPARRRTVNQVLAGLVLKEVVSSSSVLEWTSSFS
jgi:DNA-binding CsgD family transcriptional regulator